MILGIAALAMTLPRAAEVAQGADHLSSSVALDTSAPLHLLPGNELVTCCDIDVQALPPIAALPIARATHRARCKVAILATTLQIDAPATTGVDAP